MIQIRIVKKNFIIAYFLCFLLLPLLVFLTTNITNFDFRSLAGSLTRLSDDVAKADLNTDKRISIADYAIWISYYTKYAHNKGDFNEIADLNKDNSISISDYAEWINAYKKFTNGEGIISVNVELSIKSSSITIGESTLATANVTIDNGNKEEIKEWTIEDSSIAYLSGNSHSTTQTITGTKKGITNITVTTSSGATASLPIEIKNIEREEPIIEPEPAKISIDFPNGTTVYKGEYIIIEVTLSGGTNDTISKWESSNPNVIDIPTTLSTTQKLLAKNAGTTEFTIYTINGAQKSTTLTVTEKPVEKKPAKISASYPNGTTTYVGEYITLEIMLLGGTNDSISGWESSNPDVIDIPTTLDNNQKLLGKKIGKTVFTIKTANGGESSTTLTVIEKQAPTPATISVNFPNGTTAYVGEYISLEVTLTGGTNDSISDWESSNPDVIDTPVTRAKNQKLLAKKVGTTEFTVHTTNGGKYTETLTVKERERSELAISVENSRINVGSYTTVHATLTGDGSDKIVSFEAKTTGTCTIDTQISQKTDRNLSAIVNGTCSGTITVTVKTEKGATAQAFITVIYSSNSNEITYRNYKMSIPKNWTYEEVELYVYSMHFTLPTGTELRARVISIENLEDIKINPQKIATFLASDKFGLYGTSQVTNQGTKKYTDGSEYYYFDMRTTSTTVKYLYIPTPDGILFEVAIISSSPDSEVDSVLQVFRTATVNKSIESSNFTRTIMMFMAGSDLETEYCVDSYTLNGLLPSEIDYSKTNILLYTASTDYWCNSIIKSTENAIYKLTDTGLQKLKTYNKSAIGSSDNLKTFINYVYDNYKADKYDLIMYNHGGGPFGLMSDSSTKDVMTAQEMADGLKKSNLIKDRKLDSITFHTCLNGNLELLSYIYPYTNYIIASEELTISYTGYSTLEFINYTDNLDTVEFGKKFVTAYKSMIDKAKSLGGFKYNSMDFTYAILDSSKIGTIVSDTEDFFTDVNNAYKTNQSTISQVRNSTYQYGIIDNTTLAGNYVSTVDLNNIVNGMKNISSTKASKLMNDIKSSVLYNLSTRGLSNGLSIYFPTSRTYFQENEQNYGYSSLYSQKFPQYYNFIKKYNGYSASYAFASIGTPEKDDSKDTISLTLSEDQINTLFNAEITFYKQLSDGSYQKILQSDNVKLLDNSLVASLKDIGVIKQKDDNNKYIFTKYISKDDLYVGYGSVSNKDKTTSKDIEYYLTNQRYPKLYGGYMLSSQNISVSPKIPVILSSWDSIITHTNTYNSSLKDTYKSTEHIIKINDIYLEKIDFKTLYPEDNFYYVFSIQDVNGNIVNTALEKFR